MTFSNFFFFFIYYCYYFLPLSFDVSLSRGFLLKIDLLEKEHGGYHGTIWWDSLSERQGKNYWDRFFRFINYTTITLLGGSWWYEFLSSDGSSLHHFLPNIRHHITYPYPYPYETK